MPRVWAHFGTVGLDGFPTRRKIDTWVSSLALKSDRGQFYLDSVKAIELRYPDEEEPEAFLHYCERLVSLAAQLRNLRQFELSLGTNDIAEARDVAQGLLVAVKDCPIRHLSLAGAAPSDARVLGQCLKAMKRLETLELSLGIEDVFEQGEFAGALAEANTGIRSINVHWSDAVAGIANKLIHKLDRLEAFSFWGSATLQVAHDGLAEAIGKHGSTIKKVSMSSRSFPPESSARNRARLGVFEQCSSLEEIILDTLRGDETLARDISALFSRQTINLRRLFINQVQFDAGSLARLVLPGQLDQLRLFWCSAEGRLAQFLRDTRVKCLEIELDILAAKDWIAISKITDLERLVMTDVITDIRFLEHVVSNYLPKLEYIAFSYLDSVSELEPFMTRLKSRPRLHVAATRHTIGHFCLVGDGEETVRFVKFEEEIARVHEDLARS